MDKTRSPQTAFVLILRAADRLHRRVTELLKPWNLTPGQYNVLRILRGAGPEGCNCSTIAERLIQQDPDITRLLDRLERQGLVERARSQRDRRAVVVQITSTGSHLLSQIDGPLTQLHHRQFEEFSKDEIEQLTQLLRRLLLQESSATEATNDQSHP